MNRSDSEEMAGRLLAAGCAEAPALDDADLIVINTCAIREGAEQKVIGRQGQLGAAQGGQPGPARRADRLLRPRAGPGGPAPPLPGGRPVPAARRGARARRPARAGLGAGADRALGRRRRRRVGRTVVGVGRRTSSATRAAADRRRGASPAARRSAPGCRSSTAATRPAPTASCRSAAGPERSRPFDEIVDEARALAARRLPRGDAARPERQLATATTCRPRRASATSTPSAGPAAGSTSQGRPDLAELIRAIDGAADGRRPPGDPAPALRHLAPVGPVRPADRGDGRLPVASASTSTCRSSRATTRCSAGWAASTRSSTTSSASPGSARPCPGSRSRRTSSSGSAARPRRSSRRRSRLLETRPLRPGLRGGLLAAARARRRRGSPTTCRPTTSAAASTTLLALQEAIGLERNQAWLGREVEVLVDSVVPPRARTSTTTTAARRAEPAAARRRLSGRTRGNKLVHLAGSPDAGRPRWSPSGSTTPARTRCAGALVGA